MSTLKPRPPYSPEELKQLYPEGLELKMVQVLFRHGERTPVSHRLEHLGVPKHWPYCQSAALFKAAVLNGGSDWSQLSFRRRVEEEYPGEGVGLAKGPGNEVDNLCLHGELTDRGRETTLQLGQRLRHLYMKQLNFLPEDLPYHPDQYYLRGSAIVRSQISLKQVFIGLYPNATTLPHNAITIFSRSPFQENLFPNRASCRRLSMLFRDFADLGAKSWNDHPDMKYVQSKIGKYLTTPIAIDGRPRLSGIVDNINTSLAHGKEVRLPEEFYDPDVMEKLDKMNTDEWFRGYAQSLEYRRLGVGSIMGELKDNMIDVATRKSNRKLGLYGAHDTTVGAILASLGAFDGRWPPYTSNIAMELFFKRPKTNRLVAGLTWFGGGGNAINGHYVRIRYNDVPVVVQGCKAKGKHLEGDETLCTLEAFKQIVEKMQPKDWIKECNSNLDKPGIPPVEPID